MSMYGSFTIKEWLAFHCVTKYVDKLFREALKNNDQPMAVLALAELIKCDEIDLVTDAILEATDAGYIASGTNFSTVFANALAHYGNRNPTLRHISQNVRKKGTWPGTAAELLENGDSVNSESSAVCNTAQDSDNRLSKFLKSFKRKGQFSVEFGIFVYAVKWNPHRKKQTIINIGEHCTLIIKDGFVRNEENVPKALKVLDVAGIADPLPEFKGKELDFYSLEGGKWIEYENRKGNGNFYVTYYSAD